jgi:hypothetical protein
MAKGGTRARSGPPPDPMALRRDRPSDGDWIRLPAEGRKGNAPAWPLRSPTALLDHLLTYGKDGEPTNSAVVDRIGKATAKRELEVWRREWRRPQAVMWERLGLEVEVAFYVRALVWAEAPDAPVNLRTFVKQLQESLGISLPGLARNRWVIADAAPTPAAAPRARAGRSGRERFQVVTGGGGD